MAKGKGPKYEAADWPNAMKPWSHHQRLLGISEFAGFVTSLAMQNSGTEFRQKISPHRVAFPEGVTPNNQLVRASLARDHLPRNHRAGFRSFNMNESDTEPETFHIRNFGVNGCNGNYLATDEGRQGHVITQGLRSTVHDGMPQQNTRVEVNSMLRDTPQTNEIYGQLETIHKDRCVRRECLSFQCWPYMACPPPFLFFGVERRSRTYA
ncbi:hypothetical protein F5B20DRAFT_543753 [Whalleya microplaca]|nr:hypothetical protein F5B20DRAFT_543753 [Whalleya microplaca]